MSLNGNSNFRNCVLRTAELAPEVVLTTTSLLVIKPERTGFIRTSQDNIRMVFVHRSLSMILTTHIAMTTNSSSQSRIGYFPF